MYIGNDLQIAHPSYKIIDDISSGFNGSQTSFALQVSGETPVPFPISTQQVMISVNGVVQEPDPNGSAGFKLLGSNIVFSSAPANGHAFFGVINAGADYVTAGSEFPDGSATAPSFTFQDDQDTGWFRSGSGAVGYSANGAQTLTFDGNGLTVTGDASFVGDSSKNLLWDKSAGALEFADNAKATFGTGSDLSIYHDTNNSFISSSTGNLKLVGNANIIIEDNNGETLASFNPNSSVDLYHNNVKKFETTSTGANLYGHLLPDTNDTHDLGSTTKRWSELHLKDYLYMPDNGKIRLGAAYDFQFWHNGSHSAILGKTGHTYVSAPTGQSVRLTKSVADNFNAETMLAAFADGAVELYHNNVKMLETNNAGAVTYGLHQITGAEGGDAQLYMYADEGDDAADKWRIKAQASDNTLRIQDIPDNGSWDDKLVFNNNGGAELYYDNNKVFETIAAGLKVSRTTASSSYIEMVTSGGVAGYLYGQGNSEIHLMDREGHQFLKGIKDGAAELYYDNSKKFETTNTGIDVTGVINVNGSPLSAAPTITGTASGAIAAHKACIVHTDGTFKQVVATVTPQTPAVVPSTGASAIDGQAVNTSTAQTGMAIAHDSINDNFGFVWRQNNNVYFKMAARTTPGEVDLTVGGALFVQTGHSPTMCFDSTKEQFVVFNTLQTDSTQVAKGYGYTNSSKNAIELKWTLTIDGNQCQTPHMIFHPGINKPILVFRAYPDSKAYATIITIASDGASATKSTSVELSGSSSNTVYMREVAGILYDPDRTDKLYIGTMMDHTNAMKCVTLTVASTSLTRAGDDEVVSGSTSDKVAQRIAGFVHDSNTGKDILLYKQNSDGLFYGKVATTSDTGISVSSKTALTSGSDTIGSATAVYDETLEKIVVIFQDEGDSNKGKAFAIDTSGTNPSAGTVSNALTNGDTDVGANNFVSDAVFDSKTRNIVWTGTDAGNNTWPRVWNLKSAVQTTNMTTENFIGFADAAYSNSATATVNVVGNTTTQSSLTAGQKYFVTATGALSTAADIPSVEAGTALSSTKLLINPGR